MVRFQFIVNINVSEIMCSIIVKHILINVHRGLIKQKRDSLYIYEQHHGEKVHSDITANSEDPDQSSGFTCGV